MSLREILALFVTLLLLTPGAAASGDDDDASDGDEDGPTNDESSGQNRGRGRGGDDNASDGNESSGRGNGSLTPPPFEDDERPGRGLDDEDDDEDEEKDDEDDDRGRRPAWTASAQDRRGRDDAAAERNVREAVGHFTVTRDARDVAGRYVAFTFNDSSVTGVTVQGLPVFHAYATTTGDGDDDTEIESRGARIDIETRGFELRAHDNPGAVFKLGDADAFTFEFPNGTTLSPAGDRLRVQYPSGETALLLGEDGWTVNGTSATTGDEAVFVLNAAKGAFDKHREELSEALGKRHLGAEVTVVRGADGAPASGDAITFGNVSVDTLANLGNVTLVVEGHGFDGRVLVVNVDPALFNASTADELTALFDGKAVQRASSLTDVLDPDDDGLEPEYWVVEDANGYQVMWSIPHYSVHTLSLVDSVKEIPPSVVVGLFASLIVVAAGGFVLFRGPSGRR